MLEKMREMVCGNNKNNNKKKKEKERKDKIKGTVVLMKKNVLDMNDAGASLLDRVYELFGKRVELRLISSSQTDLGDKSKGKIGKGAYLKKWVTKVESILSAEEISFEIKFKWDEEIMGVPGAFLIENNHHTQLFLKSLTLHDVDLLQHHTHTHTIHFLCNSWVYPSRFYNFIPRLFFVNKAYLPCNTPDPLRGYREEELLTLRGNGSAVLKEWDRVYDYACYNDLGIPEKGEHYVRPLLGGSQEYPYPRRCRTGRAPNKKDPNAESRLPLLNLNIYVPRDERFSHVKFSDFLAHSFKALGQVLIPEIASLLDKTFNEFDSFLDVLNLYEHGVKVPKNLKSHKHRQFIYFEFVKELMWPDNEHRLKFPLPDVIKEDKTAWRTDEEFAREMLAGLNPVVIQSLQEFPPRSKLDPNVYGNQDSSIKREQIERQMDGLDVYKAMNQNKMFILDHHDALMPYLRRINTTKTKIYATRTFLFLQDDNTLKPLAIELSLPHPQGDIHGATSQIFTPAENGVEALIWQLAKAYASVNDSGYHQLISHWLRTHAVIEPFVIATNRQLSVLHPIHKLLKPHFRDTMNINALARHTLINAGGILELTVFPARYSMEMSSSIYKDWVFTDQALPIDLIKRGMAVPDPNEPRGLRLVIEDYPYAVDGLDIWTAIEEWVHEYCSSYYHSDTDVQDDYELQSWWDELRNIGHGDLHDKQWWPKMQTFTELTQTCTIIIWIASALHAAVNFGQYPYAGYLPNRPASSRRLMPTPGTPEYAELSSNPEVAFLKTITPQFQTLLGLSLIEMLSQHSKEETYLGQPENLEWTYDHEPREAFKRFGDKLMDIEKEIMKRNADKRLKNRYGPVNVPYTLLYPNTSDYSKVGGLTGKGIPNSVSI